MESPFIWNVCVVLKPFLYKGYPLLIKCLQIQYYLSIIFLRPEICCIYLMNTTKKLPGISRREVINHDDFFSAMIRNISSVIGFKNSDPEESSSSDSLKSDRNPDAQNIKRILQYTAVGCLGLITLGLFTSSRSINAG